MIVNMVGAFRRNAPFGTEIAFAKGMRRLGHTVLELDPDEGGDTDDRADATLVFKTAKGYNGLVGAMRGVRIVYQPDDARFPHIARMLAEMHGVCDCALTFSQHGVELCRRIGYRAVEPMLLTADDEIYRPVEAEARHDFCFVGSLCGSDTHASRRRMIDVLAGAGFSVAVGHDMFDVEKIRHAYCSSIAVLNHATDVGQPFGHGYGYQCRHFEAGMTGACVLTNAVDDAAAFGDIAIRNVAVFDSERSLLERAEELVSDRARAAALGSALRAEIRSAHMPEHRAAQLVRFIEANS